MPSRTGIVISRPPLAMESTNPATRPVRNKRGSKSKAGMDFCFFVVKGIVGLWMLKWFLLLCPLLAAATTVVRLTRSGSFVSRPVSSGVVGNLIFRYLSKV